MSIKDVLNYDRSELKNIVFKYEAKYKEQDKYFTIKLNLLIDENENQAMITITDSSHLIQYNNEK